MNYGALKPVTTLELRNEDYFNSNEMSENAVRQRRVPLDTIPNNNDDHDSEHYGWTKQ